MEVVDKSSASGKHFSYKVLNTSCVLEKHVSSESLFIGGSAHFESSVNNGHIVETLYEFFHAIKWEFWLVKSENLKIFEVVDIAPNYI